MTFVYRYYDQAELERQLNARATVPDITPILARYASESARMRARLPCQLSVGCRLTISVAAPFVWRCLSRSAVGPFPHSAHRTGQADLPHPALGQDLTPFMT